MQWAGSKTFVKRAAMADKAAQEARHTIVPWFRNDLRLHDSAILQETARLARTDPQVQVLALAARPHRVRYAADL
jgi:deoxyribodipyrimidine photolyase